MNQAAPNMVNKPHIMCHKSMIHVRRMFITITLKMRSRAFADNKNKQFLSVFET